MQERRNSSALAIEFRLSCTDTSIYCGSLMHHIHAWPGLSVSSTLTIKSMLIAKPEGCVHHGGRFEDIGLLVQQILTQQGVIRLHTLQVSIMVGSCIDAGWKIETGQTCIRVTLYIWTVLWVRSLRCGCLATWFCYHLIAKPGNKTTTPQWSDPYQWLSMPLLLASPEIGSWAWGSVN